MDFIAHAPGFGLWHPIFVHFPIVLFSLTLFLDILYSWGKLESPQLGTWCFILGVIALIPTLISGWAASQSIPPKEDPILYSHMLRAFFLAPYTLLYLVLRLKVMPGSQPILYVLLSFALVGLTYWTSNFGGLLTHGETPFSEIEHVEKDQKDN